MNGRTLVCRDVPVGGFLRLRDIIGDRRRSPPIAGLIPVSASTFWHWVRTGKAPKPVKLGPMTTAWRSQDIHHLIDQLSRGEAA